MPRLEWDKIGERIFETGVDHCVLYPQKNGEYPKGVAWNGITSITENPSGAEDNPQYADNIKYLNLKSAEDYGCTIECFYYPDEWAACNGEAPLVPGVTLGQQRRNTFGLSYRTRKGNDTENDDYGYKLNLVYGCSSAPSDTTHSTVNDSPEAGTFSFEVSTTPITIDAVDSEGKPFRPVARITIDSTVVGLEKMKEIENILWGNEDSDARLPLPSELKTLFAEG